ncbi:hypothetical protein D1641_15850 [Colidextribacter sp. OB.20]|uniref:hypothetical protein n=1 Tax=Colidextribacter sp. OB.20 TaxID=2304568 RepID=UPI0013719676|nr:hypothetical protein [Colidextribacter sp. OB.20]NBI11466.1 hypothetical protein [Colidextribacter sp. OB.20]
MLPNFWVSVVILGGVLYLLYRKGLVVTKCIAAILFVFRPGREADRVKLDSCTGWVQHVGRFRKDRTYEFSFEARLSQGDAEVSLLDRDKCPVLKLSRRSQKGRITLTGSGRYYLRWDFQSATGQCELRWQEIYGNL